MIKETNVQKTVVLPKAIAEQLEKEAELNFCSFSTMVKQILIEHCKGK